MSDGHFDAAGYCAMCDAPTDGSDMLCSACAFEMIDDEIPDETLDWESRAQLAFTTMMNGNLTDGINLVMRDGDVRPDSVKAALRLVGHYYDDHTRDTHKIIGLLIRLIDTWERK